MQTNQRPPIYKTEHYSHESQSNVKTNNHMSFSQSRPSVPMLSFDNNELSTQFNDKPNLGQQSSTNNYVPPSTARFSVISNHNRRNSNGSTREGSIEKTNMMSSENPFPDPARLYDLSQSPRNITSITSPRKSIGSVTKSLNLSDENPFHAVYGSYRYPSQVDPSKRITTQNTNGRSTDSKSLDMSGENPFSAPYERYQPLPQVTPQKRLTEPPKITERLFPTSILSDSSSFSTYRPSLIRQYSASDSGTGYLSGSSSIADWARNNPAPLLYRPIQVHRPPPEYYNHNESSYKPPSSPVRSQQQQQQQEQIFSRPAPIQSQLKKTISSAPPDKTSLNMSPDNPFAPTHGRYHYPSPEEIKSQKRTNEHSTRFIEPPPPIRDTEVIEPPKQMTEHPESEKKDVTSDETR